jgi:hypothetical protein
MITLACRIPSVKACGPPVRLRILPLSQPSRPGFPLDGVCPACDNRGLECHPLHGRRKLSVLAVCLRCGHACTL